MFTEGPKVVREDSRAEETKLASLIQAVLSVQLEVYQQDKGYYSNHIPPSHFNPEVQPYISTWVGQCCAWEWRFWHH
jgi:hypothetical protein